VFICDECVELAWTIIREAHKKTLVTVARTESAGTRVHCRVLGRLVIGQDHAKDAAVGRPFHNHYKGWRTARSRKQ